MSVLVAVGVGAVAFFASVLLTRPIGRALTSHGTWAQVVAGLTIVVVAVALAAYGVATTDDVWWGLGLGLGFGGLSGIRYGRGTPFDTLGRSGRAPDRGAHE